MIKPNELEAAVLVPGLPGRKLLVTLNAMLRDGTDWRLATA